MADDFEGFCLFFVEFACFCRTLICYLQEDEARVRYDR